MGRIRDGHIGYREAIAVSAILFGTKIFLFMPRQIVLLGDNAGWMITIIATILGLAAFLTLARLMARFPEKSLVEVNEEVVGPFFGVIFSLIIFFLLFYMLVVITRENLEIIKTTVLPLTPISVLAALFLSAALYASYQGIEAISRGTWLFSPFILGSVILIIVAVFPFFRISNLFPLLGSGPVKIAWYGLVKVSLFVEILTLGVLYPYIRQREKFKKIGVFSVSIAGLVMTAVIISYILSFPVPASIHGGVVPLFQLARLIFFGRFVQRIEALFVFIWVFSGIIKITLLMYSSAITLGEILKLPTYKPLLFPLFIIAFTCILIPINIIQVMNLDINMLRVYGGFALLMPVILLFISWLRKKGRKHNVPDKN